MNLNISVKQSKSVTYIAKGKAGVEVKHIYTYIYIGVKIQE